MRKPISMFMVVLALLALLALLVPQAAHAGTGVYPIPGTNVTLTMTTPNTYSRCSAGTDTVTVTGMPSGGSIHLLGNITVAFVKPGGGRQVVPGGVHHVDTTSNLTLQVSYPPIDQWPVQSSGTAEIHVDVAIEVFVNGSLKASIGPGQQWDVFCNNRPTPTSTSTNTTVAPTATPSDTSIAPSPTSTSTNTTVAPTATPSDTSIAPTPTSTSTNATVAPSPTPTSTNVTPGPTSTNTPTSTHGAPSPTPTSTNTPGNSPPQPTVVPSPTPTTAVTPAGIPVTGEGPGLREIGIVLLAMLGVGLVVAAGAGSLAGRGRRPR